MSNEIDRGRKLKRLPLKQRIPIMASIIVTGIATMHGSGAEGKTSNKHDKVHGDNGPRYSENNQTADFSPVPTPAITVGVQDYSDILQKAPEAFPSPIKIDGTNVYGVSEPISNQEQIDLLYASFDKAFDENLTPEQKRLSRDEQRDLLPANKRFLELIVTQSTYQSFLNRKEETGVDFPQWINLHTELMTQMIKNGTPSTDLSIEVLRIIVVDDSFESNPTKYSKDTDASWFVDEDYRTDEMTVKSWMFRYQVYKTGNDEVTFYLANKEHPKTGPSYTLKIPGETYKNIQDGVLIDTGLIHELSHQILNLPDEYMYDVHGSPVGFKEFRFNTGNFATPHIDPYVSMLIQQNVEQGVRGYYTDPEGVGTNSYQEGFAYLNQTPDTVSFYNMRSTEMTIQKTIFKKLDYYFSNDTRSMFLLPYQDFDPGNPRRFSKKTPLIGEPNVGFYVPEFIFSPQTIDDKHIYSTDFLLQTTIDGKVKSVFIPRAIFNMSKLAGVNEANYKIDFLWQGQTDKTIQKLTLYQASEMDEYMKTAFEKHLPIYAIMRIQGTDVWCVWTLE